MADAVERLFAGATEALNRAANCNDAGWHKFRLGTAAAYQQWAQQMEPLGGLQARIDENVAMITRLAAFSRIMLAEMRLASSRADLAERSKPRSSYIQTKKVIAAAAQNSATVPAA